MVCDTLHILCITYIHCACCMQCVVLYDAWYMLYNTYVHIMALVYCSAASIPLCAQVLNQFNMTPDMWENAIKQCWSENHCRLARYVLLRGVSTYVRTVCVITTD